MTEYIEREAVNQVLRNVAQRLADGEVEAKNNKDAISLLKIKAAREILNTIDDELCFIPSADVQPLKHSRWTWDSNAPYREDGAYKCDNCGCHSDFEERHCNNCGARMDGDTNG